MPLPQEIHLQIAIGVFALVLMIQLFYYLRFFTGVFQTVEPTNRKDEGVSVIICTRNNRPGLEANLPVILSQDYPNFEVVVVNDGSTDGSIAYLDELAKVEPRLKVLHLDIDDRFHRGKKFAQTIGIKGAKHNWMLFTDSDCTPESDQWIRLMTSYFSESKQLVLGVGRHQRQVGFINWVVQLETFHTALLYINFALKGKPYMGIGRNLAYKRDLFFSVKGFASHQHILSGDDDLFVNETSTNTNVAVCLDSGSHTLSTIKGGLAWWVRQKKRHYSTGRLYRSDDKMRLATYFFSLFFFYAAFIYLLTTNVWMITLIGFGIRFFVQGIILFRNTRKLGYEPYFWVYPFMDLGVLLIQLLVGIRGYFHKPKSW